MRIHTIHIIICESSHSFILSIHSLIPAFVSFSIVNPASFKALNCAYLRDLHVGRIFNSARFDAVPIFEKNGGNTNAESFVQLLDDAAKLALDNNENVTKDKSLLTDPNMVDIALGSDDVNIGKNTLTNTNRAFGKLFLQYWAYKLLVNDKSFYSRVPADYDHEQTYTVGNEEFNFKSGMEHNAKCLYRYLLQTQQMALRLTFPEGMLDDLATPSLKQILAKGRE